MKINGTNLRIGDVVAGYYPERGGYRALQAHDQVKEIIPRGWHGLCVSGPLDLEYEVVKRSAAQVDAQPGLGIE